LFVDLLEHGSNGTTPCAFTGSDRILSSMRFLVILCFCTGSSCVFRFQPVLDACSSENANSPNVASGPCD
jgi:hypothetical protein